MDKKLKPLANPTEDVAAILYQHLELIRPPEEIRSKLDIGYFYEKGAIEFFEIRPDWQDPAIIRHHPYVRIKFVKAQNHWKLYWLRASGKWESYTPFPSSTKLRKLLEIVEEDKHGCFHGQPFWRCAVFFLYLLTSTLLL